MKSQACLLATVSLCLSMGAVGLSCKKRAYNEKSEGASSLTGNSDRFLAESIYNIRKNVKKVSHQYYSNMDSTAPIHFNDVNDKQNRYDGYEYTPGMLDRKLQRLRVTSTTQSAPSDKSKAKEMAADALSRVIDSIERQVGRFVTRGQIPQETVATLCTNFAVVESMGQELEGKTLTRSKGIRDALLGSQSYLDFQKQVKLRDGQDTSSSAESMSPSSKPIMYVEWLDSVMEFSLVQGPLNILAVARISPSALQSWRSKFQLEVADPDASTAFETHPAVVFPDGRIAVGSPRVGSGGKNPLAWTDVSDVIAAACNSLVKNEGGTCAENFKDQPFLAAFQLTINPQTGIITDIRDAYASQARGKKQQWAQNADWSEALDVALMAHGLVLHNEPLGVALDFLKDAKPIECNVGSK